MSVASRRLQRTALREDLSIPLVPVQMADTIVDTMGVNIHGAASPYTTTTTAQLVEDVSQTLGFRHVRMDRVGPGGSSPNDSQTLMIRALYSAGVRAITVLDDRGVQSPATRMTHILNDWPVGSVLQVSGPNEPNNSAAWPTPADWPLTIAGELPDENDIPMSVSESVRQMIAVNDAVAGSGIAVACSPFALKGRYTWIDRYKTQLPSPYPFSRIDAHFYQAGRRFEKNGELTTVVNTYQASVGPMPLYLSENGYHNLLGTADTHFGTSESVAAIYLQEYPFRVRANGVERAYLYELYDEPNRETPTVPNKEAHFGLFSAPGVPKPAAVQLGRIMSLYSDPGASFTPTGLRFTVSGGGSDFMSACHQKRDGSWLIALWRRVDIWDYQNMIDKPLPSPANITVRFSKPRTITGYSPSVSGVFIAPMQAVQTTLSLAENMVILRVQ